MVKSFRDKKAIYKPLVNSNHRTTLPQSALRADSSLREGAGGGGVPFNVPPGNHNVAGDFHRPYEGRVAFNRPPGSSNVAGDFHRPYEGRVAFNGPLGNPNVGGRFSSPLRKGCAIQPTMFPMAQVRDRRRGWWSR